MFYRYHRIDFRMCFCIDMARYDIRLLTFSLIVFETHLLVEQIIIAFASRTVYLPVGVDGSADRINEMPIHQLVKNDLMTSQRDKNLNVKNNNNNIIFDEIILKRITFQSEIKTLSPCLNSTNVIFMLVLHFVFYLHFKRMFVIKFRKLVLSRKKQMIYTLCSHSYRCIGVNLNSHLML